MQVRVISEDSGWGSIEDSDLADFMKSGKIVAFFCPCSIEWVYGFGSCEICRVKHLAPSGNFHTCLFHRKRRLPFS